MFNVDSVTVNRDPSSHYELPNKKEDDESKREGILVRFNQTLENYLKVSVGNDTFKPTKFDKIQFIDTTKVKFSNSGANLLQKWNIKYNDKNRFIGLVIYIIFIKSTKTISSTSHSAATSMPPTGDSFIYMYI